MKVALALACLACAASAATAARASPAAAACPPAGFDSAADLDLTKFIEAPWYPQEQMPVFYQPVNSLYCVRAKYTPITPSNFADGLNVINTARTGSVTGPQMGSDGGGFSSIVALPTKGTGATATSKLQVGPGFLAPLAKKGLRAATRPSRRNSFVFGPYWVVDYAPDYSWAIISGGAPKVKTAGGCSAGRPNSQSFLDINGSGLWLFSRKPVDPEATQIMRDKAAALGFDVSVLKPVAQAGCTYPA
ncbi:MAG: hypothetical protein J3K34DRAFT_413662 [Monoraphidium minutum]|nr:MAG: hypothetical protein J3K34DRAFT_413662 [Monoraphidium minutum]